MAVSLKKTHEELHKIDLSKSSIPGDLPECTPVHLLDEDETIQSRSVQLNSDAVNIHRCNNDLESKRMENLQIIFLAVLGIICFFSASTVIISVIISNVPALKEFSDFCTEVVEFMLCNPFCCTMIAISFVVTGIRFVYSNFKR